MVPRPCGAIDGGRDVRQFLLATVLVAGAVGAFFGGRAFLIPAEAAASVQSLGDLAAMSAIVTDVQAIVGTGDLAGAETRITDLETAWDDAEAEMQPKNPEAWGRVDDAIDASLSALRAATPDAAAATETLAALTLVMSDPTVGAGSTGGMVEVDGIAVTDDTGHPLPCEVMLTMVKDKQASGAVVADAAALDDLVVKATERCNADDDRNADAFSAAALKLLGQS
jgi:hypothetical protein